MIPNMGAMGQVLCNLEREPDDDRRMSEREACEMLLAAAFNDKTLYVVCPDCNGTGQVNHYPIFPGECRCGTGFVKVWPKEET